MWNGYDPPELPNSVGRGSGNAAIFPVTPATPVALGIYGRTPAVEVELSSAEKAGMLGVEMRKNFVDRACWGAALRTDAAGRVKVDFELPDNLTAWRVQSWAFGREQTFGDGRVDIEVSKELQIRPVLPQAAVVGDELQVGLVLQNHSAREHEFRVTMDAGHGSGDPGARRVRLAPGEEGRAEWKVRIEEPGMARFRFRARSADGSLRDGAELPVPVAPRRVPVTVVAQAEIGLNHREAQLELRIPEPVGTTDLQVRLEANKALGSLAVLPDLVGYPYGCTEQTLNRFLPTLIAWKAVDALGLEWEGMQRSFARQDRSMGWVRGWCGRHVTDVPTELDDAKVRGMIYHGLKRLDEQGGDGSWGWFSSDDPDGRVYLTALAVRGIARAEQLGFRLKADPGARGARWLESWARRWEDVITKVPGEANPLDAFVTFVLGEAGERGAPELKTSLLGTEDELEAGGVVLLALAMDKERDAANLKRLVALARDRIEKLPADSGRWWRDPVELRAWFLKLLVKAGAGEQELEREILALCSMRADGIRWKSTRDSALCVEAIMEAAMVCGADALQDGGNVSVTVTVAGNGQVVQLGRGNLWTEVLAIPVVDEAIRDGRLPMLVRGDTDQTVSVSATLTYESSAPEHMEATAEGIKVGRRYFRHFPDGSRHVLADRDELQVGDLVEVELRLTGDGDLRFVHLRDPMPAGLEPLVQLSGYLDGAYRESRTGETHLFFSRLHSWNRTQRYHLRAVTPGAATALPARAECMYAPEMSGQSAWRSVRVGQ